jgi:hypothetical protein
VIKLVVLFFCLIALAWLLVYHRPTVEWAWTR